MKDTIYQRDIHFNQKWFTLTDNGLQARQKSLLKASEFFVNYEDIGPKIIKAKEGKQGWLIAAIFFVLLSIFLFMYRIMKGNVGEGAEVFYLCMAAGCGLIYFFTYKSIFYLAKSDNTNAVEFLVDKPSQQELTQFLTRLQAKKREMLLFKYGRLNKHLSYEQQYNTLLWLFNNEVLSKEELTKKVQELDNIFGATGFNFQINEN